MREAHPVEREVGIEYYVSDAPGVGGRLRESPADFRVRELEAVETEPIAADSGAYPHLVLRVELRDWETNEFASVLADRLGISRERVSWAGTKDKRAVTTQLFSVKEVEPAAVPTLDETEVTVVGRTGRPVLFGDLAGNRFEVVVRDASNPEHVTPVTRALRDLAGSTPAELSDEGEATTVGVPNFFGQQRFGSRRPVTHEVGLAIARGDWEGAVMAYVGNPGEREPTATHDARALVEETRDWHRGLAEMPRHLGYERAMLHTLHERTDGGATEATGADYQAALEAVPTTLQQLFVHAAQSYAFNLIVSERLERGLPLTRPVRGDAVCFAERRGDAVLQVPDTDRHQRVTPDRVDAVRRHCERGRAFVTGPLIGTDTTVAEGEPGEIERSVLESVGLAPGDFDRPGEFHSTGTRRAIALRTDLTVERDPLKFEFALPKGSYATVLLREYLKCDPEQL